VSRTPGPADEESDPDAERPGEERATVGSDWESRVMRRIAPHVAEVLAPGESPSEQADDLGWERPGLEHLARRLRRKPSD